MPIKLSKRVLAIKPSQTLTITTHAEAMRAAGKDVINLSAGEPDFDTPKHIKEAAIQAIQEGKTRYTAVDGIFSLKQAVIQKLSRNNNCTYKPSQILISNGGKQGFYNLVQAILNPGDEVLIPVPYWVSYPDMVMLADGTPIFINTNFKQRFKITPYQLESAITDKTRLFIINSPSNPTGMVYTIDELKALSKVLQKYPRVLIATDDIYEHILWTNDPFYNILNACNELSNRTIILNGISKAYSMTGWRIGYAAGPEEIIQAMKKVQSQSTSNPVSISQAAAETALNGSQECIIEMLGHFKKRHDYVVDHLNKIPGIECLPSDGTFYVFPKVKKMISHLNNVSDDLQFSKYLIEQVGIALVPGTAFGLSGHMRISIATSMKNLSEALKRLKSIA